MATYPEHLTIGVQSPVKYNAKIDTRYTHDLKSRGQGGKKWPPGPQFYRDGNIIVATKESLRNQEVPTDTLEAVVAMNGVNEMTPEEWDENFAVIGLTHVADDPEGEIIPFGSYEGITIRAGGGGQMFAAVKDGAGIYPGQMFKIVAPEIDKPPLPFIDSTFDNNNTGKGKQYIPQIVPIQPGRVVESWGILGRDMINEKNPPFKDSKPFRGTLNSKEKTAFVTKNGLLGMAFNIIQKLVQRNILQIVTPQEISDVKTEPYYIAMRKLDKFFSTTDSTIFNAYVDNEAHPQNAEYKETDDAISNWKNDKLMWLASLLGITGLEGDYQQIFDSELMTECVTSATFGLAGGLLDDQYLYPKTNQGHGSGWAKKVARLRQQQVSSAQDLMFGVSEKTSEEVDKIFGVALTGVPRNQKHVARTLVKQIG
jgi:hypothetical protein